MNTSYFHRITFLFTIACALFAADHAGAASKVTVQLDQSQIALGEATRLTVTTAGNSRPDISSPDVPGLDITAIGQSSQYQYVNGVGTSTLSVVFQVVPQKAGTFTIPSPAPGGNSVTLRVTPGSGGNTVNQGNLPPPQSGQLSSGGTRITQDGSAFVRLKLPRRELFVGETVPVEIQVGVRPGLVAALNGLPTLNGDEFTLNKLSSKPEQTAEVVGGQQFTVLTWHSALAAVKPGKFSVTMETPLTVRMRTRSRMPRSMFGDPFDDPFNDPFFQNFFGGTTEKQITVASEPDTLTVQEIPQNGRPENFNGAVGDFEVAGSLSSTNPAAGDPVTLQMTVSGSGNFDRVKTPMLAASADWKTYTPSDTFAAEDSAGYSGKKTFEQALIPLKSGDQTVPPISFSYFNPETQQFETRQTDPIPIHVSELPQGGGAALTTTKPGPSDSNEAAASDSVVPGLRPDHVENSRTVATLRPLYFKPWFVAGQGVIALGFAGALVMLRVREKRQRNIAPDWERVASEAQAAAISEMNAAVKAGNRAQFFQCARRALQQQLGKEWGVEPGSITVAEIDMRDGEHASELRDIFVMADRSAYSGEAIGAENLERWQQIVRDLLQEQES